MANAAARITRRAFGKLCAQATVAVGAVLSGCSGVFKSKASVKPQITCDGGASAEEYEYIVVGSGAGGGPLAANLARKGHKVLLLEAGGDYEGDNYQVPVFHPLASEDPDLRWDFFVRHYQDEEKSRQDDKFCPEHDGVLYPRSGALGGCTAHNAMILLYPHNSDWDHIASITGDPSWRSDNMRRYFERLENCQYIDPPETPGQDPGRHGFKGWLPTSIPAKDWDVLKLAVKDGQLRKVIFDSLREFPGKKLRRPSMFLKKGRFDPNDWRNVEAGADGLCFMPLTTYRGKRAGSREYIRDVERACGGNLTVKLHALATRVLLDEENRAVGVEYLAGERLYRADRSPSRFGGSGKRAQVRATREVILSGGAFNTPQLLLLSGIGPSQELQRHGIDVRVDLPGVGENLQDRYEVAVVTEMKNKFSMLENATFSGPNPGEEPDPFYAQWQQGKGLYTTNGTVISFVKRSLPDRPDPDLCIFGMPGFFKGYYPGYSERTTRDHDYFTWAILKAHTNNTAGSVKLRSSDPREVPKINFRYFDEGNDPKGEDLASVVDGIEFVRRMSEPLRPHIKKEIVPGEHLQTPKQLKDFVKQNAWGHHASCTCKMGSKSDRMAVVDSRFRVHGAKNLRVVDASVFPKVPGLFIVSAVYMISEKASDTVHEDAVRQPTSQA